jgi:hypothetical protein
MVIFFILPSKILLVSYSPSSVVDLVNNQNRAEFVACHYAKILIWLGEKILQSKHNLRMVLNKHSISFQLFLKQN